MSSKCILGYFFRRGYLAFRNLHDFCLRFVCNRITPVFKGECSSYSFKFDNIYGSNGQTETHRSCRRFIPRKHLGWIEGGHRVTQQFLSKLKNGRLPFTKRFRMLLEWTFRKEIPGLLEEKEATNQQNLVTRCFCWSHFRQVWSHPRFLFWGSYFWNPPMLGGLVFHDLPYKVGPQKPVASSKWDEIT